MNGLIANEETTRPRSDDPASFRDPASVVHDAHGRIYRVISKSYFSDYSMLMLGFYQELIDKQLLIPHEELCNTAPEITIQPEKVYPITYPYEWCFSMLKEAALNTLEINRIAMQHGMMLKDASAYNMQYHDGKMKLIDTCSFMKYEFGMPWGAYSQFLRHFLCPLLLMAYVDSSFGRLSEIYLDGVPVQLATRLLPKRLRFSLGMWVHIYSQAMNFIVNPNRTVKMSSLAVEALLNNLANFIRSINYKPKSPWLDYKNAGSYNDTALFDKQGIVNHVMGNGDGIASILDLGCNTGSYCAVHIEEFKHIIAVDIDHDSVEIAFERKGNFLPLVIDICNPSPAIGWANKERPAFWDRIGQVDTIMALAIIHHLCIRNNVPLSMVADLLADHCRRLIIEFVPLEDPQAQKLLGKKNIPEYSLDAFKSAFGRHFNTLSEIPITDSMRTIYAMEKR